MEERLERRVVLAVAAGFVLKGCGDGMTVRDRLEGDTTHTFGLHERTFETSTGQRRVGTLVVSVDGERRDPRTSNKAWMFVILRGDNVTIEFDEGIDTKRLRTGDRVGFIAVTYEVAKDSSTRTRRSALRSLIRTSGGVSRREVTIVI